MKIKLYLLILIYSFCFNPLTAQTILNCENDSTGLIPLTDLGIEMYGNYTGGLYPGGLNERPFIHEKNGIKISNQIVPLNNAGEVDWVNGEVLFIGMGPSVASNAFNTFINLMNDISWEGTNACLKVKGLFLGGKDLTDMIDTTDNKYWNDLKTRLDDRGDSWEKVQLVWMFQHSEIDSLDVDYYVTTAVDQYTKLFNRMTDSMQNLKQVYLSGFHYTGFTDSTHKRYQYLYEPYGYWSNLVIKEVIGKQINGDPLLSYRSTPKMAPYLSWGPYYWADGKNPRGGDSLTWLCEDFRTDATGGGFHLEEPGRILEAEMLIDFFNTDPVASVWYLANSKWDSCAVIIPRYSEIVIEKEILTIYPNPVVNEIHITLSNANSGDINYAIYNSLGSLIHAGNGTLNAGSITIAFDNHPVGLYTIQVKNELIDLTARFYALD